jgi:hypothetical protein
MPVMSSLPSQTKGHWCLDTSGNVYWGGQSLPPSQKANGFSHSQDQLVEFALDTVATNEVRGFSWLGEGQAG